MDGSSTFALAPRENEQSSTDIFLSLVADPFTYEV